MTSNTQMRIKGSDGVTRVIHADGTILASDNRAENLQKVKQITFNSEQNETMLLGGIELEKSDKTVEANADDSEMMLPTGFSILANGEIETPDERLKRLTKNQQNRKPMPVDDSEILLPAGIKLEQ